MPVRTIDDLISQLDRELSWRKKELTTLKFAAERARPHEKAALYRANLCLLYAHWEGFVKAVARDYLEFVSLRRLPYRELQSNFLALGIQPHLLRFGQSRSVVALKLFADAMLEILDSRSDRDFKDVIDARGNLNYEALANILVAVGVSEVPYVTKRVLINEKLLGRRNSVAHGDFLLMDGAEYSDLHTQVLGLIERLGTDLENAAFTHSYLR